MFREMRLKKQVMSNERNIDILKSATSGVLAVSGDDDYSYAVPLSYVYDDGKLYFHSASTGHKLDAIAKNKKVSFCVIEKDTIIPEEYTTYFRSVIAFGKARLLTDEKEKKYALETLAKKYSPGKEYEEGMNKEINQKLKVVTMIELKIEHLSGKEASELVK